MATTTNNGWTIPAATDYVKDGYAAIDTLGNAIDTSTGKGLIAWQTWAPTLSGGWLNGNGTWSAKYCQLGKIVIVKGTFTIGSTTTKGTNLLMSLPVTAATVGGTSEALGNVYANSGGAGTFGIFYVSTTTTARMLALNASGTYLAGSQISSTVPGTWATADNFSFNFSYEAA